MEYIKKIGKILCCIALIYCFRFFSVQIGFAISKRLFNFPEGTSIETLQQYRILLEIVLHIVFLLLAVIAYKIVSRFTTIAAVFLLMVLLSPILFEISGLINDKTCLKPWQSLHKAMWYFPMQSIVFAVSAVLIFNRRHELKWKENYAIIFISFVVYQCIKPW